MAFLATTGHELDHLGLHHVLDALGPPPAAVLHVGACLAAGVPDGRGVLRHTETRSKRASVGVGVDAAIGDALAALPGEFTAVPTERRRDAGAWVGEAVTWAPLDRPLVSVAGSFPLFHTRGDTPARATTPALLRDALDAVLRTGSILLDVLARA